jgi:hypothetical protein
MGIQLAGFGLLRFLELKALAVGSKTFSCPWLGQKTSLEAKKFFR